MTNENSSSPTGEKCPRLRLFKYLATGRFTEAEIILSNNPALRSVLLHMPGLRHTEFFKRRMRFYRDYARSHGMTGSLNAEERQELRTQFAASHCKTRALTEAAKKRMNDFDIAAFTTEISRVRFQSLLRKRKSKRGFFL